MKRIGLTRFFKELPSILSDRFSSMSYTTFMIFTCGVIYGGIILAALLPKLFGFIP